MVLLWFFSTLEHPILWLQEGVKGWRFSGEQPPDSQQSHSPEPVLETGILWPQPIMGCENSNPFLSDVAAKTQSSKCHQQFLIRRGRVTKNGACVKDSLAQTLQAFTASPVTATLMAVLGVKVWVQLQDSCMIKELWGWAWTSDSKRYQSRRCIHLCCQELEKSFTIQERPLASYQPDSSFLSFLPF